MKKNIIATLFGLDLLAVLGIVGGIEGGAISLGVGVIVCGVLAGIALAFSYILQD